MGVLDQLAGIKPKEPGVVKTMASRAAKIPGYAMEEWQGALKDIGFGEGGEAAPGPIAAALGMPEEMLKFGFATLRAAFAPVNAYSRAMFEEPYTDLLVKHGMDEGHARAIARTYAFLPYLMQPEMMGGRGAMPGVARTPGQVAAEEASKYAGAKKVEETQPTPQEMPTAKPTETPAEAKAWEGAAQDLSANKQILDELASKAEAKTPRVVPQAEIPQATIPTGAAKPQVVEAVKTVAPAAGVGQPIPARHIEAALRAKGKIEAGLPGKRMPLESGEWTGVPSTYPEFFKNKGYTKKDIINILDKAIDGKPLTALQRAKFDDIISGERSETAAGMLKQKPQQGPQTSEPGFLTKEYAQEPAPTKKWGYLSAEEIKEGNAIHEQVKTVIQPALDNVGREVASSVGGSWQGVPKSAKSLLNKVNIKRQAGKTEYNLYSAKDHARGTIFIKSWEDAPQVIKALADRGFATENTIEKPMNHFGYRGINSTIPLGNGLSGEIQIHTAESWKVKLKTDEIYRKWRTWDRQKGDPAERMQFIQAYRKSARAWEDYFNSIPRNLRAAISAPLSGRESMIMPPVTGKGGLTQALPSSTKTPAAESLKTEPFSKTPSITSESAMPSPIEPTAGIVKAKEPWEMTREERANEVARLKRENAAILATPLISEGSISETQVARMGKQSRAKWGKNAMQRMDIESQIKDLQSDERLERSRFRAEKTAIEDRESKPYLWTRDEWLKMRLAKKPQSLSHLTEKKYLQFEGKRWDKSVQAAIKRGEIKEGPIEPKSVTLQSTFIPGAKEFIEQDVIPAAREAANTLLTAGRDIRKHLAPITASPEARRTGEVLRENLAEMAKSGDRAEAALFKTRKLFDKRTPANNLDFVDNMEHGATQGNASFDKISGVLRKMYDERRDEIRALGTGKLEHCIENYFAHIWKDPQKAGGMYAKWFARRPFEGAKSFLKKRTIPTMKEGVDLGLEPVSWNPVDLTLLKIREMDKYLCAHKTVNELKDEGIVKFVRATQKPDPGMVKLNDRMFTVYAPRSLQVTSESGAQIGTNILGYYYAPEEAARIMNNYLSPGLHSSDIFNAYRYVGNVINQFQLGFSAFHMGFTTLDAATSRMALGLNQLVGGSPIKGLANIASVPIAPFTNIIKGNKLLKEWYAPGSQGAEMGRLVDALSQAGGRVKMDRFYRTETGKRMMQAFRSKNYIGGILRLPVAAVELGAKPMMEFVVPRQKLGVFADLASWELERLAKRGAGRTEVRATMQKIWDSVDNRMGQLIYDNLFWNRTQKDLLMASVRSLGWNLGTFRELGGGMVDLAKQGAKMAKGERPELTYRMAYTMALPITVGTIGAITGYLMTGEGPQELKDYFFPRTGRKNPDGSPERLSMPSYMKDVYAYYDRPGRTLVNKIHPALSIIGDMLRNNDYYGTDIRNAEDPIVKQALDELKFTGKQMAPFSLQGALQNRQLGATPGGTIAPFFGVTPAPKHIQRSKIQNEIYDTAARRRGRKERTQFQFDKAHARSEIAQAYAKGDQAMFYDKLKTAVDKGYMENSKSKLKAYLAMAKLPSDIQNFKGLPPDDQERILKKMSVEELAKYAWYAKPSIRKTLYDMNDATREFVNKVNAGEFRKPEWVPGYAAHPEEEEE